MTDLAAHAQATAGAEGDRWSVPDEKRGPARSGKPSNEAGIRSASAGFLVRPVRTAVRAELLQRQPVGVVPPVLVGDVVAVLALLARQRDLGTNVGGGHGGAFLSSILVPDWPARNCADLRLGSGGRT